MHPRSFLGAFPNPSEYSNYKNARSALRRGRDAAAMEFKRTAVADATALQGAFGT